MTNNYAALLDQLRRTGADPDRRVLITGGTVLTMDPALGTLETGDVLIQGSTIADVAPDLRAQGAASGAIVIDATDSVLTPGFVDTHRHAWEAQLRRIMPDVNDLGEYVMSTLAGMAPAYRPHDMYVGTRLAALTAIDCGITTMLDFSHNSRSAAHSDSAIRALLDTGIRGVHASMRPHFGDWEGQWPGDLTRLKDAYFGSDDQLLTLRVAILATDEIAGPELAYGTRLHDLTRDLGIGVSVDAVFGPSGSEAVLRWQQSGLLSPEVTLIHCTGLTQDAWRAMADTGATVSLAPTSDPQIGLEDAVPAIDDALGVGIRPGLSIDFEVALASDMFTQMRTLHAHTADAGGQRSLRHHRRAEAHQRLRRARLRDAAGRPGQRPRRVTGSLTPDKKADVLVFGAEELNNMPLNDPVGTVVLGSDARNITTVFIDGQVRKWEGEVLDVDLGAFREDVGASRDHVLNASAG